MTDFYMKISTDKWIGAKGNFVAFNGEDRMAKYRRLAIAKKAIVNTILGGSNITNSTGVYTIDFSQPSCPATCVASLKTKPVGNKEELYWETPILKG